MASTDLVSTKVRTTALLSAFEVVAKQLDPFIVQGSSNVSGKDIIIFTNFFGYLNKFILLVLQMMAFVIVNLRTLIMGSIPGMKPMWEILISRNVYLDQKMVFERSCLPPEHVYTMSNGWNMTVLNAYLRDHIDCNS